MSPLTVAIDARLVGGSNTGDSTYWTGLLYGLAAVEPRARLLLFSNTNPPPEIPVSSSFEWVTLPTRSSRWWSLVQFPLAARRAGADILHTQYTLSPLAQGGVTTIHDVSFFIGPEWFKPRDRLFLTKAIPASVRRAVAVITVSQTSRAELIRFVPQAEGKTWVTPNACPPWVQAVPTDEARGRVAELGIAGPYLLTVGTRWPRKNMSLAIKAANLLPAELPHRLVVTGKSGWGDQDLGERGNAVGYVDNYTLACLYSAADLYLAPSRHEGFGIPLLEAFRCGCPVLCSSGGALPEVAGDAAQIMTSFEPEAWSQTIQELLGDSSKMELLRTRGRAREGLFSWEETARRTLEAYEGALP